MNTTYYTTKGNVNTAYYTTKVKGVGGQGSRLPSQSLSPKPKGFARSSMAATWMGVTVTCSLLGISRLPPILSSVQTRQKSFDDVELNVR